MKKRGIAFLLSAVAGFLHLPAHAEHDAARAASAQAIVQQRGSLYRIRHQDKTSYLFGTVHVGKADFFPLEPRVTQALQQASRLVLEIDIRDDQPFQQALTRHGLYAGDDTLERHLSPASQALLKRELERFGIAYDNVQKMKPWLLANMLVGLDLERHGYRRAQGIEVYLLSAAGPSKAVDELESAEYQMTLFDGMEDGMQEQYLHENLIELGDGSALKKARLLIDAWAGANDDAAEDFLRESLKEKTTSSEFTRRVLLDRRNPEMADKIEALLKRDESVFVGVGMLHLLGASGLPALLRERGYEVEKLY
jgi:hypothetical protein